MDAWYNDAGFVKLEKGDYRFAKQRKKRRCLQLRKNGGQKIPLFAVSSGKRGIVLWYGAQQSGRDCYKDTDDRKLHQSHHQALQDSRRQQCKKRRAKQQMNPKSI